MATLTEEEEILTFDVSDEALEIAGSDKTNFTWGVCTLDQRPRSRRAKARQKQQKVCET
jgi:hypothetical protein